MKKIAVGSVALDRIDRESEATIVAIEGGLGVRQRFNQMGIHVGDQVVVKRSGILSGPILIFIHGTEVALGRRLAGNIKVRENQ